MMYAVPKAYLYNISAIAPYLFGLNDYCAVIFLIDIFAQ